MTSIGWRFLEVRPEGVSQDPTHGEFFAPEEGLAGALVREALQNSLDARPSNSTSPAEVRFHFGEDSLESFGQSSYFRELREHLRAAALDCPSLPEPVPYLVVEDFGTRGLQGDPGHTIRDEKDERGENRNDFFYFWRNIGRSRKEATDRGRWGLGKTVFPASSRINSFFGLTVRLSDQRKLLMGQSVLKVHRVIAEGINNIYEPYGFFGSFSENSNLALAIEHQDYLSEFSRRFSLSRSHQPGLSIVIPFPKADIHLIEIAEEVIRSYYTSILSGELRVIASNADKRYEIDRDSIVSIAAALPWEDLRGRAEEMVRLVEFADRALHVDTSSLVHLTEPHPSKAPESLKDRVPESHADALRAQYDDGELVGFRIPLLVKRPSKVVESYFDAFIQRDPSLVSGSAEFVREGLSITQTGKSPRQPARGLILVRDKQLSTLLGDAENPAHTKWQELSEKIKEPAYIHGRGTVRVVNNGIQQLVEYLAFRVEQRDRTLLSDIFFLPEDDSDERKADGTKPGPVGESPDPVELPEPKPRPFILEQISGGFKLAGNPAAGPVEILTIEVAYAIRNGNPFKRYRTFDFDLREINMSGQGLQVLVRAGNQFSARVVEPDFALHAVGFDTKRDLEVKVLTTAPEADL
jgi:hypothetical protein